MNSLEFDLLPQHGVIVVGRNPPGIRDNQPGDPNAPVKLYRTGDSEPIELPILAMEMYGNCKFSYSDYLDKYVVVPSRSRRPKADWSEDEPVPIYLVAPDGKVDTVQIPPGYWHPHEVFPSRAGLIWVSNDTRHGSRDAGGWVLRDGKVTKLFDQLVDGAGVSPDGCTIVYATNDFDPKTIDYVQAMNLRSAK